MKINILKKLITNLLSVQVSTISFGNDIDNFIIKLNDSKDILKQFSNINFDELKKIYHPNTYYEIIDSYKLSRFAFTIYDKIVIIGPYIKKGFNDSDIREITKDSKMKNHYLAIPIIDTLQIENTVNACIKSIFKDINTNYEFIKINDVLKHKCFDIDMHYMESFEDIIRKYEVENALLNNIENGEVDKLFSSYKDLSSLSEQTTISKYINEDPKISLASLRALARKSAERSGLPTPIIEEIVHRHTKIMNNAAPSNLTACIKDFLMELTSEVKKYLLSNSKYSSFIKQITDYIYTNSSENLEINFLAKKYNVSIYYLERKFKAETSVRIHDYIEKTRIEKAEKLLLNSDLLISEIGSLVGYDDNNYFTKVFKKHYNLTPSKFRILNRY